jgi:hypothetical protein
MGTIPRGRLAVASYAGAYYQKVLRTSPAHLIAYWPLWDRAGVAAEGLISGRGGTYTGVTLGQDGIGDGRVCPYFDGANDYASVYSASLKNAFDGSEGSLMLWLKVNDASVWADGLFRYACRFKCDDDSGLAIYKRDTANRLTLAYTAGGSGKSVEHTTSSPDWLHVLLTWTRSGDAMKAFVGGVQTGSTQTGLGNWAGSLKSDSCNIGAHNQTPQMVWNGLVAHVALWSTPLTPAEISRLAVARRQAG